MNDAYAFWRYADLIERNIISGRSDLHRKQTLLGFPKATKLVEGRGAIALFPRAAVQAWVDNRLGRLPDEPAADAGTGGEGTGHQRRHAGGDAQGRRDPVHQHRSGPKARDAALRSGRSGSLEGQE